ncbi:MAG: hypothetical protein FWF55_09525 [Treponema sp.]|nr:hypothetical protein [Treponema sp.]
MRNFDLLDNNIIELASDVLAGVENYSCYPGGELLGVNLSKKNILATDAGEFIPAYTENHRRKNKYSVEFYPSGAIKKIALDAVQEAWTPLGELPAELVTFYESGELNRVFPLDGKISGMWSEQEEKTLAVPLSFEFPFTAFTAIIGGIAFFQSGNIRSITLFPGETVTIAAQYGAIKACNGFSLYETGELESLEPFVPVTIQTPIGAITAYDANAVGINADINSLIFNKDGNVISLTTVHNNVTVQTADKQSALFAPREVINPLDDESTITEGLKIAFNYDADTVTFNDGKKETTVPIRGSNFTITAHSAAALTCRQSDCANCSLGCKN